METVKVKHWDHNEAQDRIGVTGLRTRGRRGVALIMMALLFAVFLAFSGLVFDIGFIVFKKRLLQSAADAAAFDGAIEKLRGNTGRITSAGKYSARINGYTDGVDNVLGPSVLADRLL